MPSRWGTAIHIYYIEIVPTSSTQRVKVTTKLRNPFGMIRYCTIHPSKLSKLIRLRILFGDIRWLFIQVGMDA